MVKKRSHSTTTPSATSHSTERLTEHLRELRLPAFRDHFQSQAESAAKENLSYPKYLEALTSRECEARTQSRIMTATDVWLDLISLDFFNLALPRRSGEADTSFRNRIKTRLFRYTATRQAIITGLTILTGRTPLIIEPWNNGDCGSWDALGGPYNGGIMAYSTSGAWGSILLPYQFFVQVKRQNLGGVIGVQGYTAQPQMVGGYGVGAIEYVSAAMVGATVQDADIYQTILDLKAEGTIAWVNISS